MIYKCGDSNFKYAWLDYMVQDPVHPSIGVYRRITGSRTIFVYSEDSEPQFIISARMGSQPARNMREILMDENGTKTCATFYSIFRVPGKVSKKGMGGEVLRHVIDYCKLRGTEKFYTLSPIPFLKNEFEEHPKEKDLKQYLETATGPVEKFHLGNGAVIAHINTKADDSELRQDESWGTMVNYNYTKYEELKK